MEVLVAQWGLGGGCAPPRRQSLLRSQARCALLSAATPRMMGASRSSGHPHLPNGWAVVRSAPRACTPGCVRRQPRGQDPGRVVAHLDAHAVRAYRGDAVELL